MDHCAAVLLAFPTDAVRAAPSDNRLYHESILNHCKQIDQLLKDQSNVIGQHILDLLDVSVRQLSPVVAIVLTNFKLLDPAVCSISYLALLQSLVQQNSVDDLATAQPKILTFLLAFDARQIRYAGSAFATLFNTILSQKIIPVGIQAAAFPPRDMADSPCCLGIYSSSSIDPCLTADRPYGLHVDVSPYWAHSSGIFHRQHRAHITTDFQEHCLLSGPADCQA